MNENCLNYKDLISEGKLKKEPNIGFDQIIRLLNFVVLAPGYGIFCLEIKSGDISRKEGIWKRLWIEAAREIGRKIPEPRYKPVYYQVV